MKYKLRLDLKLEGTSFYRIEALKDFSDVKKGDLGGYVQKESNLSQKGDCWIYNNARVSGNSSISEDARIG